MNRFRTARLVASLLLAALAAAPVAGQTISTKGQVTVGVHEVEMKADILYLIKVEGKGFQPQVAMSSEFLSDRFDFNKPNLFQSHYVPNKDKTATFLIVPALFNLKGKGPFEYTFEAAGFALAKSILDIKGELVAADAAFKQDFGDRKHHKSYELKLDAGQAYVVDMKAQAGSALDCFIYLLDDKGKVVGADDDGGGSLNSRLVYLPPASGTHRLIATGLGDALGGYTLTVRSALKKE